LDRKTQLLNRLDAIGAALQATGEGLALLALGSVGVETDRIDVYSDLDFFAIVKPNRKQGFLDNLDWMAAGASPIAYSFQNTVDGHKVLYEDGIFAEFAVFEPRDLSAIPFALGRIVWKADEFDALLTTPSVRTPYKYALDWLLGEALTNLYVGMGRHRRGETMAALRLIQVHAVNQVMRLAPYIEADHPDQRDPFSDERRFEKRLPGLADQLPSFMQGYNGNVESTRAILAFLDAHFEINAAIKARILELCDEKS